MKHFDDAVISGIIGINKPDQRIFEHASQRLDLAAGQILFLDDLPHNVAGAREAGLEALLFSTTQRLSEELAVSYPQLPLDGLDS
ncbi:MAG: HAD-IA family hydrolase [Sphaerochaeta sp.]|nr:HAD-IA family hydrolase [Sphaerochaeta sp.]